MGDDSEMIEQIFHIEEMKTELEILSNNQMVMHTDETLSPALHEQFLNQVLAYERAEMITHKELLERDNVMLPSAEALSDDELALKLIEVIHTLATHRIFLENTNHLSERELYTYLWRDALNEWGPVLPPDNPMNCHFDMVGSGSEEHIEIWLKYYADEKTRADWAKDFPDHVVPLHEDPPYDRDRHLPTPPEPPDPYDDPEVVEHFFRVCREKLERKLASDNVSYGSFGDEPLSYCPDLACVWAIYLPNDRSTVGWWAISGDVPTTYLPIAETADPRTFLHAVSKRWLAAADTMERGDSPSELPAHDPKRWPQIIPMLRDLGDTLTRWANDDTAWDKTDEA